MQKRFQGILQNISDPVHIQTVKVAGIYAAIGFYYQLRLTVSLNAACGWNSISHQIYHIVKQLDAPVLSFTEVLQPQEKQLDIELGKPLRRQGMRIRTWGIQCVKAWGKLYIADVQFLKDTPYRLGMPRYLPGQRAQNIVFNAKLVQKGQRLQASLISPLPIRIYPGIVVALGQQVQGDPYQEVVLRQEAAPLLVQKCGVGLQSIADLDPRIPEGNGLYEFPEPSRTRKGGFSTLKGKMNTVPFYKLGFQIAKHGVDSIN